MTSKTFNRLVGTKGEEIAEKFLKGKGFLIIEKNYATRFGEIDLIVANHGILVFCEVKLKEGEDFGTPEEMIGPKKLFQVERMANLYLVDNSKISKKYQSFRIDAVCIVLNEKGETQRIDHYENITF